MMGSASRMLLLPAALLALLSEVIADQPPPTAIKKQVPDANEKLFPDHLAFAPLPRSNAYEALDIWLGEEDDDSNFNATSKPYRPAFALHRDEPEENVLRRAAEVLALLQKRNSCPTGMSSCSDIGSPNRCCPSGTYCAQVSDSAACCPNGATCGGGVGNCPGNAVSCAADIGGGCCIPGYICQGEGCVPSASATGPAVTAAPTSVDQGTQTITSTQTTIIEGSPSTVVVTLTVTQTTAPTPTTETIIVTATGSGTESATGVPPWRLTDASSFTTDSSETQTGCPTGFYGCLATHGGGCCRTDRDCNTYSCPATSTTIVSNGATIVVPLSDVPATPTPSACAGGWFLCGRDAGPTAGCCPSGYQCGTASCFTTSASRTEEVQKTHPEPTGQSKNLASGNLSAGRWQVLTGAIGACLLLLVF